MKRNLFIAIFLCSAFLSTGQSKISFFDFVESFDWGISQSEFEDKYQTMIVEKSDTAEMQYVMSDMYIDKYPFNVSLSFMQLENEDTGISLLNDNIVIMIVHPDSTLCMPLNALNSELKGKYSSPISLNEELGNLQIPEFTPPDFGNAAVTLWQFAGPSIMTYADIDSSSEPEYYIMLCNFIDDEIVDNIMDEPETDFRHSNWGDSMSEVMAKERKNNISEMPDMYIFKDYLAGREVMVWYGFTNDKLYCGKYNITYHYPNDNYIEDYEYFLGLLTKKYGKPIYSQNKALKDDLPSYLNDEELIKGGYIEYGNLWRNQPSFILLQLSLDDYGDPYLTIQYLSLQYNAEAEANTLELL